MSPVDTQWDAILRGLEMTPETHTPAERMRAVTLVTETVAREIRQAVAEDRLPKEKLGQFRDGTYPSRLAFQKRAKEWLAIGQAFAEQRGAR